MCEAKERGKMYREQMSQKARAWEKTKAASKDVADNIKKWWHNIGNPPDFESGQDGEDEFDIQC